MIEATQSPLEILLEGPLLSDPRLAPNGRDVACVDQCGERSRVFVNGVQWTLGASTEDQPRWSPDGNSLAYRSDRGGSCQIYTQAEALAKALKITDGEGWVQRFAWSPDGRRIAFVWQSSVRHDPVIDDLAAPFNELRIVHLESLETEAVVVEQAYIGAFAWSPDGDDIVYALRQDPDLDGRSLPATIRSVQQGVLRELPGAPDEVTWLRDGIYYVGTVRMEPGSAACLYRLDGTRIAAGITDSLVSLASDDSDALHVTVARGLTTDLLRVSDDGAIEVVYSPGDGDLRDARVRGASWVGIVSAGSMPPTIIRDGEVVTPNPLSEHAWVRQEPFSWTAPDGLDLDGVLMLPERGAAPYPTVVLAHGGGARYTLGFQQPYWGLSNWGLALATAGYAVLMPNFRGGPGHGDAFEAWRNEHGAHRSDWIDIDSAIDSAVEDGIADPDRLGIGGWSHGGYMAAWGITHSDRFGAAVMGAGLSMAGAAMSETDIPFTFVANMGSAPWDGLGPLPHRAASPIVYASAAKTPTLIIHGAADDRCPPGQSRGFYRALRAFGCTTEMVMYPREGHFIREPAHRLDLLRRVVSWFDRWIGPES